MTTLLALLSATCAISAVVSAKDGTPAGVVAALLLEAILAGGAIAI